MSMMGFVAGQMRVATPGIVTPPIGDYWEEQGGYYAGVVNYPDGRGYHLIVADKSTQVSLAWKTVANNSSQAADYFDGFANTAALISDGIGLHPAAQHCADYRGGGHADWYLFSSEEAKVLRTNLGPNEPATPAAWLPGGSQAFGAGGTIINFWGCRQYGVTQAHLYRLSDNSSAFTTKTSSYSVRPIRRVPVA